MQIATREAARLPGKAAARGQLQRLVRRRIMIAPSGAAQAETSSALQAVRRISAAKSTALGSKTYGGRGTRAGAATSAPRLPDTCKADNGLLTLPHRERATTL